MRLNHCTFSTLKAILSVFTLSLIQFSSVDFANAITIDEFDTPSQDARDPASQSVPNSSSIADSKAIGGFRSISAKRTAGNNIMDTHVFTDQGIGELSHSQGSGTRGRSYITWDGDNTPDAGILPSKVNGLNKLDLWEDNADAFKIVVTSYDFPSSLPIELTLVAYDGNDTFGNTYVVATRSLNQRVDNDPNSPNFTGPLTITIPFIDFLEGQFSAPVAKPEDVFRRLGSLVLYINGDNGIDKDLSITRITTNGECDTFPVNGSVYGDCRTCVNLNDQTCFDCKSVPFGPALPGTACDSTGLGACKPGAFDNGCSCKSTTTPTPEICGDGIDNDCDGLIDEIKTDACGVCGGDGSSCADCAGTPNGNSKVDSCGVCGGDDSSCKDCAGNPNGTAKLDTCGVCNGDNTSCLGCEAKNISDLLFALDAGAKEHEKLITNMIRALGKVDKTKSFKSYAAKTAAKAHELQLRNWVISWTIPIVINTCSNQVLCSQKSNESLIAEYRLHSQELFDIGAQLVKRMNKLKISSKKYSQRNASLHKENLALSEQVPVSTSVCG